MSLINSESRQESNHENRYSQGEAYSMNDYDGNKRNIVPGRWAKYQQAIQVGQQQLCETRSFELL